MRIGELAKACDCPIETIRYYEKIGLLVKSQRAANGYRLYDEQHKKWLQFILRSRELGFRQDEVRRLANIANEDHPDCAQVHSLLSEQVDGVRKKISDLRKLERSLNRLRAKCQQGILSECPVIDELMH